jgi:O-succinylbenzoic acid--CoA ligase
MLEHPSVCDCGVIARTTAGGEEIPCAFVVLREHVTANQQTAGELQTFVAERLCHYKMPREVYFIDKLPRTASGKILRRELRKRV